VGTGQAKLYQVLATMPLKLLPNPSVARHGKRYHYHHGVKMLLTTVYAQQRRNYKLAHYRIGKLCPYCGFHPNEIGRSIQQQALDAINGIS